MAVKNRLTFVFLLSLAGTFVSTILLFQHFNQLENSPLITMFCGDAAAGGCAAVNRSPYAVLLGFPLASYGLLVYLNLALWTGLSLLLGEEDRRTAGALVLMVVFVVALAVLILFLIQIFVIGALCTFCLATYLITIGIILLLFPDRANARGGAIRKQFGKGEGRIVLVTSFIGAILLLIAVWAVTLALSFQNPAVMKERYEAAAVEEFRSSTEHQIDLRGIPSEGGKNAPITIVVYSDFLCPYCRQLAQSIRQDLPLWNGVVAVYFMNYPLDRFCNPYVATTVHPGSCWTALAAVCAAEQGKFWDYHDRMFDQQPRTATDQAALRIAASAGVDSARAQACMHLIENQREVRRQIEVAHALGVTVTPVIFINGRKVPRLSAFRATLQSEAKRLGLPPLAGTEE